MDASELKLRLTQFLRFASVGLATTLLQYCILVVGVELLAMPAPISSGAGFALGAILSYLLNYRFTFQSSNSHWSAARRFALVASVGLLLNVALMQLINGHWGVPYMWSQLFATVIVLLWNFVGNAWWSFARGSARVAFQRSEGQ